MPSQSMLFCSQQKVVRFIGDATSFINAHPFQFMHAQTRRRPIKGTQQPQSLQGQARPMSQNTQWQKSQVRLSLEILLELSDKSDRGLRFRDTQRQGDLLPWCCFIVPPPLA